MQSQFVSMAKFLNQITTFKGSLLTLLLTLIVSPSTEARNQDLDSLGVQQLYIKAVNISSSQPDSAVHYLEICKRYYLQHGNSQSAVECLLDMIEIGKKTLNYEPAYDNSWEALSIIGEVNDSIIKSRTYRSIGMLYSYFLQKESEEYLLKAIAIDKELVRAGKVDKSSLIPTYYDMMLLYSYRKNFKVAAQYLDTCLVLSDQVNQHPVNRGFLEAEAAHFNSLRGNFKEALPLLFKVKDIFEEIPEQQLTIQSNKGFLVPIYMYIGEAYAGLDDRHMAIAYFKESLETMNKYKAHQGLRSFLHMKLSECFESVGKYKVALDHLAMAKAENDKVYDTRAFSNKKIVQIKNQYKEDLDRRNAEIVRINLELSQNQSELLAKEKTLLINRVIIGTILILLFIGGLLAYMRNQKIRLEGEKALIRAESRLKQENARNIIELKNKELTTYALQYIEKDKTISELLQHIKENPSDTKSYKKIEQSVKRNESIQWEDFKNRFLEVHKDFYNRLVAKHPSISATEIKHIALMKLNFSGKEIADMMGVSHSTVHISRYRLKKKLDIDKDHNLREYINSI